MTTAFSTTVNFNADELKKLDDEMSKSGMTRRSTYIKHALITFWRQQHEANPENSDSFGVRPQQEST